MRKISSVLLLSFLLMSSNAALAMDTAAGTALKQQIQDSLQWRLDMAKATGQGLTMAGPVEVTPKEKYYEAKLPGVGLGFGPNGSIEIGDIIIHATPEKTAGQWQTEITFPDTLTFLDTAHMPKATVHIGRQHFTGEWIPAKEIFPAISGLYEDISISTPGDKDSPALSALIHDIRITLAMHENKDGTWDGENDVGVAGINIDVSGLHGASVTVGKVSARSLYDQLDLKQNAAMKEKLQSLFKDGHTATKEEGMAMLNGILAQQQGSINGVDTGITVDNFTFKGKSVIAPDTAPQQVSFARLAFSGKTSNLRADKSQAELKAMMDGLKVSFVPADFLGLAPQTFSVDVAFDNLPARLMSETFYGALQKALMDSGAQKPGPDGKTPAQDEMAAVMLQAPKILEDAGAFMTIRDTFVKSPDLDTLLNGKITADAKAINGISGNVTLSIKGMDETLEKLKTLGMKPGADPKLLGMAGTMTVLQAMGQPGTSSDKKSLRSYNFEITPDGKFLMNGADMKMVSALAHAASGAARATPAPTATPPQPKAPDSPPVKAP